MSFNEGIADRIREQLADLPHLEEKEMMGGLVFMYNGKMCVGVIKDELLCRLDPKIYEDVLEKNGCREMDFTGKPMKGWVFVSEQAIASKAGLECWIGLALEFNSKALRSKK